MSRVETNVAGRRECGWIECHLSWILCVLDGNREKTIEASKTEMRLMVAQARSDGTDYDGGGFGVSTSQLFTVS